jgi:hypothetical protein
MKEQNNEVKKESDEIISQNTDEIEALSDNLELDDESLEKIAGGLMNDVEFECTTKGNSCNTH